MNNFAGGYFGKIVRVNLTKRTTQVEDINPGVLRKYVGGAALGAKLLYDEVAAGVDALGPENKLIYTVGPITGTDAPCASRLNISTKSPLTGAIANSLSGGYFPVEFKWAGYDGLIVEGQASEPVYILIRDGEVQVRNANKYWGLNTFDVQRYLKEDLNDLNVRISCIGPAGENGSHLACIINEARAAGRKGVGAVMGSKNLKAIVVRGTHKVPLANSEQFMSAVREVLSNFKQSDMAYPVFSKTGSTLAVDGTNGLGVLPAYNWSKTGVDNWEDVLGSEVFRGHNVTKNSCYRCPIDCGHVRMARNGRYVGIATDGPEFESIYSLGTMTGIKDPNVIIAADRLCDEMGIDSISVGVTAAMAMELYERGLYTATDGLEMRFGNGEALLDFIRAVAHKKGFAALFADGTKLAGERIGGDAPYYAMEIKGLELPGYDVRGLKAHGLNLATSYTGADHNRGYAFQEVFGIPIPHPVERLDIKGKGALTKFNQDFTGTYDTLTMCEFPVQLALPQVAQRLAAKLLTAATGWEYTEDSIWQLGERMNNLCRMFNVREGFSRKDDYLPQRLLQETIKEGASAGERISQDDLDYMLDEYYQARGWTKNGIPTKDKLTQLGLQDCIADLPK